VAVPLASVPDLVQIRYVGWDMKQIDQCGLRNNYDILLGYGSVIKYYVNCEDVYYSIFTFLVVWNLWQLPLPTWSLYPVAKLNFEESFQMTFSKTNRHFTLDAYCLLLQDSQTILRTSIMTVRCFSKCNLILKILWRSVLKTDDCFFVYLKTQTHAPLPLLLREG
jgi:hypothetical protein